MSPAEFQWVLTYQISPIFLQNGVVSSAMGGYAPIIYYLQGAGFMGLGFPGPDVDIDNYYAQFVPLNGSDLINNTYGEYPFANQQTAANALITQPLAISAMMIAPERNPGGYFFKSSIMTALADTLKQHTLQGGTFVYVTPAKTWSNLLLLRLRDMTGSESKQVQWRWQWDFSQPLITSAQAQAAQSNLINSIQNGQQQTPNANGQVTTATGQQQPTVPPASSGAAPTAVPSTKPNPVPFAQSGGTEGSPTNAPLPPNSLGNPTPDPNFGYSFAPGM